MIQYDPHHWRSHLFDIRGSMLREIFSRVMVCVVWSVLVVTWHQVGQMEARTVRDPGSGNTTYSRSFLAQLAHDRPISIPMHCHNLIGVALGLLLVFRTNASYDRFWEGRRLWGNIVNDSRNLARQASGLLTHDVEIQTQLLKWTMVFPWSVMFRLRGQKELGPVASELPPDDVVAVEHAQHLPLAVSRRMTESIVAAQRRGLLSDVQQMMLDGCVQRLIDSVGACERIHNTPLPYAYMVHLRRALIVYLATLPMALVRDFGWATVPAMLLIAYILLGVEEIGVEIEDPFGDDDNDLPLRSLCETIENNLRGVL